MPHVLDPMPQVEPIPAHIHQDLITQTWAEALNVDTSWMLDPFAPIPVEHKGQTEEQVSPFIVPQLVPEEAAA